jgi:hypothetical protein
MTLLKGMGFLMLESQKLFIEYYLVPYVYLL